MLPPHIGSTLFHTCTSQGTVVLDEAQYDYLLMLIGGDRAAIEAGPPGPDTQQQKEQAGSSIKEAVTSAPSGSGSGAGVDPSLSPLISQIRDMLPEYGSGFLAACLEHYGRKAEQARGTHGCMQGGACVWCITSGRQNRQAGGYGCMHGGACGCVHLLPPLPPLTLICSLLLCSVLARSYPPFSSHPLWC